MKLHFIVYNNQHHELIFEISADQSENNKQYQLKTKLFERITFHSDAQVAIKNNKVTISELNGSSHIQFLLNNIKKCCEDHGVTNWSEFSDQVESKCQIHSKINYSYNNLSKLPTDILRLISSKYIGLYSRPAMMRINKEITNKIDNPEALLKMHYPEAYYAAKQSSHGQARNKRHFQQLFADSYWRHTFNELPVFFEPGVDYSKVYKEFRLLILFKQGDLPEIIKAGATLKSISTSMHPLLYWAYHNGHKNILDYFYELEPTKLNKLNKAICCFKDPDILMEIIKENGGLTHFTQDLYTMQPLEMAVRVNNLSAVEFLCQQPETDINTFLTSSAKDTPLSIALAKDNLEIAKYLISYGAKLFADRFILDRDFFMFAGPKSRDYLCEHPQFALELLNAVEKIGYSPQTNRFIERVYDFYRSELAYWLRNFQKNNSSLVPLFNYLMSQKEVLKICNYQNLKMHVFATLIIKQAERASSEEVIELMNQIEKLNNDPQFMLMINELKKNFILLHFSPRRPG